MSDLDLVTLHFTDGTKDAVLWGGRLPVNRGLCSLITVDRMPVTFDEQTWFWHALPRLLAPLASIKMVKQS